MESDDLLPRIDAARCTGCARCVDICPTQALAQRQGKAALADPARCIFCTACEEICPEQAIALPFLIVFAPTPHKPAARPEPNAPAAPLIP